MTEEVQGNEGHGPSVRRVIVFCAIGAIVVFFSIYGFIKYQDAEQAAVCERTVKSRDDNRAVWEYLVKTSAEPTSQKTLDFVEFLNDRLPKLECVRGIPVPAGTGD